MYLSSLPVFKKHLKGFLTIKEKSLLKVINNPLSSFKQSYPTPNGWHYWRKLNHLTLLKLVFKCSITWRAVVYWYLLQIISQVLNTWGYFRCLQITKLLLSAGGQNFPYCLQLCLLNANKEHSWGNRSCRTWACITQGHTLSQLIEI